jgi:hypothetical protein
MANCSIRFGGDGTGKDNLLLIGNGQLLIEVVQVPVFFGIENGVVA